MKSWDEYEQREEKGDGRVGRRRGETKVVEERKGMWGRREGSTIRLEGMGEEKNFEMSWERRRK